MGRKSKRRKRNAKRKDADNMYKNGLYDDGYYSGGGYTPVTHTGKYVANTIKDLTNKGNQGIILIDHPTMQDIYAKSGPNAVSNEFQVHYWALNYRYTAQDGSLLDVIVPTTYFSYDQVVSSAHIDFMLSDVFETSGKVQGIHNMKVNELEAAGFKEKLEEILGAELELISTDFNSIHRHPGSSARQAFSSTDLSKNRADLGVVFPLEEASGDRSNFAGIMAIDNGVCNVAHYEYRLANGKLDDGGIEYVEGRCAALVANHPELVAPAGPTAIERLFGIAPSAPKNPYHRLKHCDMNPLFEAVLEAFTAIDFKPDTTVIVPEFVTTRVYAPAYAAKTTVKKAVKRLVTAVSYNNAKLELKKMEGMPKAVTRAFLYTQTTEEVKACYQKLVEAYKPSSKLSTAHFHGYVGAIIDIQRDIEIDTEEAKETIELYENQLKEQADAAKKPAGTTIAKKPANNTQPGNAAKTTVTKHKNDYYCKRTLWYQKFNKQSVDGMEFQDAVKYLNVLRNFYTGKNQDVAPGTRTTAGKIKEEILQLQKSIEREIADSVAKAGLAEATLSQKREFLVDLVPEETLRFASEHSCDSWIATLS